MAPTFSWAVTHSLRGSVAQGSAGKWMFRLEGRENLGGLEEAVTCQDDHFGSFCGLCREWRIRA